MPSGQDGMRAGDEALRAYLLGGSELAATSSSRRALGPEDLAALRPAAPPRPRAARKHAPRTEAAASEVARSVVCFCGEVFPETRAAEFMVHLRAEVGEDLRLLENVRRWRRNVTSKPEYRARAAARRREKRAADPEFREAEARKQREYRERDPQAHRARAREAEARRREADPEYRARRNARQNARREASARACGCGCGELTRGAGEFKAGHHMRVPGARGAGRQRDPGREQQARVMRAARRPVRAIAAEFGVHPTTVQRWLKEPPPAQPEERNHLT